MPSMAKVSMAPPDDSLRRLMPGDFEPVPLLVLPAVVLPWMSRQSVTSLPDEPESTRMPARAALVVSGAATLLFETLAFIVHCEPAPRAMTKMPGPSVLMMLLLVIFVVTVPLLGVDARPSSSHPMAMPEETTALLTSR